MGTGDDGRDAYRLLHDALKRTDRVGLGRWVFHNREYLVAVRVLDEVLALQTMRFADELVDVQELELPPPNRSPSKRELEMAGQLVESLRERFNPAAFKDSYREAVLKLIEAKAKGKEMKLPEAEAVEETADLLGALEASLQSSSAGRTPGRSTRGKGRSASTRDRTKGRSSRGRQQTRAGR